MASTDVEGRASAQPSSYEHMEEALSKITAKPGEDTQELSDERQRTRQEINEKVDLPSIDQEEESSDTSGHSHDAARSNGVKERQDCSIDDEKLQPGVNAAIEGVGQKVSPPKAPTQVIAVAIPSGTSNHRPPQLRPLAPSPSEHASAFQQEASTENLKGILSSESPEALHIGGRNHASYTSPSSSPTNVQGAATKGSSSKSGSSLRRGKWTVEEETYVARVIQDFNSGFLNAPAGTTLRSYLSEKLQCDPMRITKKFTGDACIGKRVFHPAVRSTANAAAIDKAQAELDTLERRWRRRLEMQQRESAKKAAANVATGNGRNHAMIQGVPVALLSSADQGASSNGSHVGQSVVTQAASWLDRANAILKGGQIHNFPIGASLESTEQTAGESIDSLPNSEIENQMKEVQRLIYEGPQIQRTTAGLPNLLSSGHRGSSVVDSGPPSPPEPADKRMRTGGAITGAEDAEALVGFLRSVRASAAAGDDGS